MSGAKTGCAVVVMGVSGSGKTTVAERLAEQLGWQFVEGDKLHPPANVEKMRQGIPLTDADRAPWLDRIGEELRSWATAGRSGVLTCSALKRAYRNRIRSARPDVRIVYLKGSEALINSRVGRAPSRIYAGLIAAQPVRRARRADGRRKGRHGRRGRVSRDRGRRCHRQARTYLTAHRKRRARRGELCLPSGLRGRVRLYKSARSRRARFGSSPRRRGWDASGRHDSD